MHNCIECRIACDCGAESSFSCTMCSQCLALAEADFEDSLDYKEQEELLFREKENE